MPERAQLFHLALLLLAVPAQYLVSRYYSTTIARRSTALKEFMSVAVGFQERYLSWRSWRAWCLELLGPLKVHPYSSSPDSLSEYIGESPATEVMQLRENMNFFAQSLTVRSPRPKKVKFHIGQVVRHTELGYRGVIIGWDPDPKAPSGWIEKAYPTQNQRLHSSPFYAILVHTQDYADGRVTYAAQDFITSMHKFQISHPNLYDYMDSFEGIRYVPRPWLQSLYPHD